jgi:hypothetical protein
MLFKQVDKLNLHLQNRVGSIKVHNPYDNLQWVLDTFPNYTIKEISDFTTWAYKLKMSQSDILEM